MRFAVRCLFLLVLGLARTQAAQATHAMGGEITYSYVPGSVNQYLVTVRLYSRSPLVGVPDPLTVSTLR